MPNFFLENVDCTESLTCAQSPRIGSTPPAQANTPRVRNLMRLPYSVIEKFPRVLSPSFHPPISSALTLHPQYIIVTTAQSQTSLNYFLEWPPLYVVRGDPDRDGTLRHTLP